MSIVFRSDVQFEGARPDWLDLLHGGSAIRFGDERESSSAVWKNYGRAEIRRRKIHKRARNWKIVPVSNLYNRLCGRAFFNNIHGIAASNYGNVEL
jgi:hypothetical protein